MKNKPVLLLDFDFTLCDSSVRENKHTKNDCLDLAAYVNDTAQYDKGLPLLRYLIKDRRAIECRFNVRILTNRDFNRDCKSKIKTFVQRNFTVLHRGNLAPIYGDNFKALVLSEICQKNEVIFIDDEPKYLQIARDNKGRAICARDLWHYKPHEFTALFFG